MSLAGVTGHAPRASFANPPPATGAGLGAGRLPMGPLGRASAPPAEPARPTIPALVRPPPRRAEVSDDELDTMDDATHRRVAFEAGAVVRDQFHLVRTLGEGPLGTTWVARDAGGGGEVLLKVVADVLVTNDRERADLVGKLGMFSGRTLPGVVMPREVFAVPGSVVVVYPYVDAVSLRAVVDARRQRGEGFTPEECLRVALALVAAVQAMHSASPHGALWPQNILVTTRGVLLVDGFVAVSVAPDRLGMRVDHHPRAQPFAAPEVVAGKRPTASADLYALGAVLAEIAGGAVPGHGPNLAAVSADLHRAVSILLDREPARRPAGVRLALDALTAAAGFTQRPAEPGLVVPESVLVVPIAAPTDPRELAPPLEPPTLQVPERAPHVQLAMPGAARVPSSELPSSEPRTTRFVASEPGATQAPLDGSNPMGRLRAATATLPLGGARGPGIQSGPPPSMAVKSGPPPTMAVKSGPPPARAAVPAPIAPAAPVPSAAASPQPPKPIAPKPVAPKAATPDVDPTSETRAPPRTLPSINDALAGSARRPPAPVKVPPPSAVLPVPQVGRAPIAKPPAPPPRPPAPPPRMPPAPPKAPPSAPTAQRPGPKPAPPPRVVEERSFSDDDGIDPRLLHAARMLDEERRRERSSSEGPPPGPPRPRGR